MSSKGWLTAAISLAVVAGAGFLILSHHQSTNPVKSKATPVRLTSLQPATYYGVEISDARIVENKVKRNERLTDILENYRVPEKFVRQVSQIPRSMFDVRKIIAGKKYTIITGADSLSAPRAFIYEPNDIDYVLFKFKDTLQVDVCQRHVDIVKKEISGVIESSLFETIDQMGMSYELTNKLVDIFAWQIDFLRLAKGDRFKVIYKQSVVDGRPVGVDEIDAASFEHLGHDYKAYAFDQGEGIDYFNDEGKSLRKALLKYPIEFTRISSRYSLRRFHPIEKIFKPHLGTDFAAPVGTPIRSVGDGVVLEATFSKYNGNFVKIRHNATYATQYLHMSKIAPDIHPGVHVRQGQWIGNVGQTGLATGPHLCYRFWKNGRQVDALKVDLPAATPIKADFESGFEARRDSLSQALDGIPYPESSELLAKR